MSDGYYSERRAVSREMRRIATQRKMTIISAIGCIVVALVILIASLVDVADAQTSEIVHEDVKPVRQVVFDFEASVFGMIPVIVFENEEEPEPEIIEPSYTEEDLELLALVIYQEAGGDACSDSTRRMVAEVVLNRIDHPMFPNTLEGVLTQYGQYGRLYWTGLVWPQRAQYEIEQNAVERAYRIAEDVLTSDYRMLPGDVLFQSEFPQGDEIVVEQDGLYFCR